MVFPVGAGRVTVVSYSRWYREVPVTVGYRIRGTAGSYMSPIESLRNRSVPVGMTAPRWNNWRPMVAVDSPLRAHQAAAHGGTVELVPVVTVHPCRWSSWR